MDRLSRDPVHLIILQDELERAHVSLVLVTETVDSSDLGKLITHIKGYAAKLEVEKIKDRTRRGKQQLLQRGLYPQGAGKGLYGYDWDSQTKKRVVNKFEAEVVKRIFEMVAGGMDVYSVAKELNKNSVPTKSSGKWHPLTVKRVVTNPAYVGITYFGKTRRTQSTGDRRRRLEPRPDKEWVLLSEVTPPIVSHELFEKAQRALERPKLRSGRPSHEYLLTGHIVCGLCGSPLVGTCLRRRYRYYRCRATWPTASKSKTCNALYIRADALENLVWDKVRQVLGNPQVVLAEVRRRKQESGPSPLDSEIARKRRQIEQSKKAEQRLIQLLRHADDQTDYVLDQINEVKKERKEAEERLSELIRLKEDRDKWETAEVTLDELCARVKNNLDRCTFQDKRLALDALAIKVTATPKQIFIEGSVPVKFSSTEQTWA